MSRPDFLLIERLADTFSYAETIGSLASLAGEDLSKDELVQQMRDGIIGKLPRLFAIKERTNLNEEDPFQYSFKIEWFDGDQVYIKAIEVLSNLKASSPLTKSNPIRSCIVISLMQKNEDGEYSLENRDGNGNALLITVIDVRDKDFYTYVIDHDGRLGDRQPVREIELEPYQIQKIHDIMKAIDTVWPTVSGHDW